MTLASPSRTAIPGFNRASGVADETVRRDITGSTTILELLRLFPDGRAAKLMAELRFPCAHCGGAVREPLTLAAKRHKRDPRAVIDVFRALEAGGPSEAQLARASERVQ